MSLFLAYLSLSVLVAGDDDDDDDDDDYSDEEGAPGPGGLVGDILGGQK